MQAELDTFTKFKDLSAEDYALLFGGVSVDSLLEVYKKQMYKVTRTAGLAHTVVLGQSDRVNHPYAVVWLPEGWIASGGGAEAAYEGAGSMLTMCKPARSGTTHGWQARAKDHIQADPSVLYVWAVGLKLT